MKGFLLIIFLLLVSTVQVFSQTLKKVRSDGLYQSNTSKKDNSRRFLRFYPDYSVLSVTSTGQANDVFKWLKKPYDEQGYYEIKGGKVYFTTTSAYGTVVYEGIIDSEYKLTLKTKSLINGHESLEVYYFIKL